MARSPYRPGSGRRLFSRTRLRVIALAVAAALGMSILTPVALAAPAAYGSSLPTVRMLGYAKGPAQHHGTAAGKAHYVPASATRAAPALVHGRGHRTPKPNLAPSPMGTPALVRTHSATMAAGHEIVGHAVIRTAAPAAARSARSGATATAAAATVTDNATYSVAKTFDTTPMADQTGRIRFPDRQLFVDLHGHTPGRKPADPADALAALLAADGVDTRYLPVGLDGRAAMWRDRMASRRVLLILDNAATSAQVAPLLPGTAGCLVLITSRRFLGDLPAVLEVPLDVLPPGDARAMFTDLAPRAAEGPDRVAELVALCGHLPLAISLLARLLTRHRSWTLADLITETRTKLLTVTAENRTVAAAFEASYQDLDPARQRFFRHLGLHPGPDIDPYAAAALSGLPPGEAAEHLDALHGDRLLEEPVPRRYRMHDLIRQYARSLVAGESGDDREQATGRLLDYYQHTAQAADIHLARHTRPADATAVTVPDAAPGLPGRIQARAWMAAEHVNLTACINFALARSDRARVTGLTAAIAAHLRSDGPWPWAVELHAAAARAAQHLGDQPSHASALLDLGDMQYLTSDFPGAADTLEQARDIYRGIGDRLGEAYAFQYLGDTRRAAGDFPGAADVLEQALNICRAIGDRLGEAYILLSLGRVRRAAGDFPGAPGVLEQALGIYRDLGDQGGEAEALNETGTVCLARGDPLQARAHYQRALELARAIGARLEEARALEGAGKCAAQICDTSTAGSALQQALDIYQHLGAADAERLAAEMTVSPAGSADTVQVPS